MGENMGSFMIGDVDKEKPTFLESYKINSHAKSITSCSFHPSKEYAAFGALDNYWSFHNMIKGIPLAKVESDSHINTLKFHPDGILMGTGHSSPEIYLWDITNQKVSAVLENEKMKNTTKIDFSENGYHMLSSSKDSNIVNLWDFKTRYH